MENHIQKIEQLVALKGQIADLQKQSKALEAEFKDEGVNVWESHYHTLSVAGVESFPVDWKALAEDIKPSKYYIDKHTGHKFGYRLTIRVKRKEAA